MIGRHWTMGSTIASALLLAVTASGQDARRPKKLIATGWDHPDTERLLANHKEMEKRPFDGVVIYVEGRPDGKKRVPMWWAHTDEEWQREWFQPCVDNLRKCRFRRFTDNFALFGANPGKVDFFDDAGWQRIVEHWRTAAWVAKAGGLKGLTFDPEPYNAPYAQYKYSAQPQREKHSFDDYWAQARLRGRQVMQAVAAEYPDITLLCYFLNISGAHATGRADPRRALADQTYGLLPAFADGWLDAAPPTVRIVDGCEWSYLYNSEKEYLQAAVLIKGACQELVSPENRSKYRAQVQAGFGVYLDAYWNPKDSEWARWYVDGLGGPRVRRLGVNVQTALRVADEYVWIYGEKFRWWPTPNQSVRQQAWPEALPGCEKALRYARDPVDYARACLAEARQAGKLADLLRNGDFGAEKADLADGRVATWKPGRPPAGWSAWQDEKSKGAFTWDRQAGAAAAGAARAAKVANGCFLQGLPAKPGERYAVRAVRRLQGKGATWLRVRWQTAEGKWTAEAQDRLFHAAGPREKWGEIFGVAEVPEGVGKLVVLLGVSDQPTDEDIAWFDDVGLYRLD
ncbi:MAG TPA: hypothetical protein VM695_08975 [Phycisphaerae bacterium]|nr:hypothetical protein [Phycisphaerae bacterium]